MKNKQIKRNNILKNEHVMKIKFNIFDANDYRNFEINLIFQFYFVDDVRIAMSHIFHDIKKFQRRFKIVVIF